jgi:hypothetical protein
VLAFSRRPLSIAAGGGALFTIVRSDTGVTPIRLDPPITVTKGGPVVLGGETPTMLTYSGGAPWIATRAGDVARLDPGSLVPTLRVHVDAEVTDMASSPDRLWVATAKEIDEVDPFDGKITASYPLPASLTRFAVSPDGTRVYASLSRPVRHDTLPVIEIDTATGSVVARTRGGYADLGGVGGLTATPQGVWIATATGMMGDAIFARASDLRKRVGEAGQRRGSIVGTNAIQLWLAARRLWEFVPDGSLQCFDPPDPRAKGYVVAENHRQLGIGGVVSIGRHVWAGTPNSIDLLVPPPSCIVH